VKPALTCRELVELVTDYLDGALPAAERNSFEAHMATCPGCEIYVKQFRPTITTTRRTLELEQRPEITALLRAFRDYRRSAKRRRPARD
jgi:anti-sigma factor RsiW